MTWYHNGKEIDYDHYGDCGPSDVWDVLVELCGSTEEALMRLILSYACTGEGKRLVDYLAECHEDSKATDGIHLQSLIDELIWYNTTLSSDECMYERAEDMRYEIVAGFRFDWKEN